MPPLIRIIAALALILMLSAVMSCSKVKDKPAAANLLPNPNSPVPTVGATQTSDVKGEPGKPQTVDVVSGKQFDRSVFADYNGERIYFCCADSRKLFQLNERSYLQKIKEKNILLAKTPAQG